MTWYSDVRFEGLNCYEVLISNFIICNEVCQEILDEEMDRGINSNHGHFIRLVL